MRYKNVKSGKVHTKGTKSFAEYADITIRNIKSLYLLLDDVLQEPSKIDLQSTKKYSGTTKITFTISKTNALNPLCPLNQCFKNRKKEKINNCTCFDSQQH